MLLSTEKVLFSAHLFSIKLNNPVETSEDCFGECKNESYGELLFKEFQAQNWRGEAGPEHP
jgi:hypothetical protein